MLFESIDLPVASPHGLMIDVVLVSQENVQENVSSSQPSCGNINLLELGMTCTSTPFTAAVQVKPAVKLDQRGCTT